tara:strand:+ start:41038 stop:42756 length:1719 start_codon:yes stop_codon:yes gene_type:complete
MSDATLKNLDNEIAIIETNISINNLYNTFLSKFDTKTYDDIDKIDDKTFERYASLLNLDYIKANISYENEFFTNNAKINNYAGNPVDLTKNIATLRENIALEVNLSKFFSKKLNIYNVYLDFVLQFHGQIHEFITINHKLDEKIYEHEFTYKMRYFIDKNISYTLNDKDFFINNQQKILKFKLNKNNIESKNINSELIIITNYTDDNVKKSFNNMLYNIDKYDLLKHIDLINTKESWKKNKFSFIEYGKINLMFHYLILLILYKYISKNYGTNINNLDRLVGYFNTSVNNNNKLLIDINRSVEISYNNKQKNSLTESQEIKHVIDRTVELKKINNNLAIKSQKIKGMNSKINEQQSKLSKINIVLIITIIIFIYILMCLILNSYINNNAIYISGATILLISLVIYIYVYNLKNTAYYIAENFLNSSIQVELEENINQFKLACDTIKHKSSYLSDSYYDIVNPLLNIELKNYREKSDNTKLYDKIASFNVNIGQRDIKFTIETIQYLVNLSILFVFILLLLKINSSQKYLVIIISFVIFIMLTTIYFVKIVRVVRTKSNNYYWDKPKPLNQQK